MHMRDPLGDREEQVDAIDPLEFVNSGCSESATMRIDHHCGIHHLNQVFAN